MTHGLALLTKGAAAAPWTGAKQRREDQGRSVSKLFRIRHASPLCQETDLVSEQTHTRLQLLHSNFQLETLRARRWWPRWRTWLLKIQAWWGGGGASRFLIAACSGSRSKVATSYLACSVRPPQTPPSVWPALNPPLSIECRCCSRDMFLGGAMALGGMVAA